MFRPAAIPSGIVSSIGSTISNNAFVIALFSIIGALFTAPLLAYVYSTYAGFYEILAGHLIKETMPVPVPVEEAQQQYEQIQAITAEAEAPVEEEKPIEEEKSAEEEKPAELNVAEVMEEAAGEQKPADEKPADEE